MNVTVSQWKAIKACKETVLRILEAVLLVWASSSPIIAYTQFQTMKRVVCPIAEQVCCVQNIHIHCIVFELWTMKKNKEDKQIETFMFDFSTLRKVSQN